MCFSLHDDETGAIDKSPGLVGSAIVQVEGSWNKALVNADEPSLGDAKNVLPRRGTACRAGTRANRCRFPPAPSRL